MTGTPPKDALQAAIAALRNRANEPGTLKAHGPAFAEGMRCAANFIEQKCPALSEHGGGGEAVAWPKVWGTGRMFDNEKALLVIFDRKPTDDELRAFDDFAKGSATPPTPSAPVGVVPEIECRKALADFMRDYNVLPPRECAELLAARLKRLAAAPSPEKQG